MPRLLVIGGAACVFDDVAGALEIGAFDAVMTINNQIADWSEPIDYAVTLHPEKLHEWMRPRRKRQTAQIRGQAAGTDRSGADRGGRAYQGAGSPSRRPHREAGDRINRLVRALLALPVAILLWKVLVWDKALGQWTGGSTDPLSAELWQVVAVVVGFYFVTDAAARIFRR